VKKNTRRIHERIAHNVNPLQHSGRLPQISWPLLVRSPKTTPDVHTPSIIPAFSCVTAVEDLIGSVQAFFNIPTLCLHSSIIMPTSTLRLKFSCQYATTMPFLDFKTISNVQISQTKTTNIATNVHFQEYFTCPYTPLHFLTRFPHTSPTTSLHVLQSSQSSTTSESSHAPSRLPTASIFSPRFPPTHVTSP
jgi:hypothetical protein